MRDYKFRAWDNEGGQYMYSDNRDFYCVVLTSGKVQFYYIDIKDMHEMHHEEAEMFTGLKDKNGKEIYEGDILGLYPFAAWVVFWQDGGTCGYNNPIPSDIFPLKQSKTEMREVIGNIHENPELLEGK